MDLKDMVCATAATEKFETICCKALSRRFEIKN